MIERTSMRVRLGTSALTSRMIFGFAPASNDSSITLKTVFSLGFSYIGVEESVVGFYTDFLADSPLGGLPQRQLVLQPREQQRASQFPGYSAGTDLHEEVSNSSSKRKSNNLQQSNKVRGL